MDDNDVDVSDLEKWDPGFTDTARKLLGPVGKFWFRAEVRGLDRLPPTGGALLVSNHSGGAMTPDVLVLAPAFYEALGYDRPLYTLAHYGLFKTPLAGTLRKIGVILATRENAAKALRSGGVVLVFPGGDYDSYRSTFAQNTIDFNGRKGYVRTAIEAGVPIVPSVSIGGQETQLFFGRGSLDRQTAWAASASDRHPAAGFRVPVRADVDDPGEFSAAVEDRPRGARADPRHRAVRREPGRRRGRRPCARGDAVGVGPAGEAATVSRPRLIAGPELAGVLPASERLWREAAEKVARRRAPVVLPPRRLASRSGAAGGPALGVGGRLVIRERGVLDRGGRVVACRRRRFDFHGVGKDRVQEMSFA